MAQADWRSEGEWIKNCNCAFGCPCDFNARPTQGDCKGLLGMRIIKGYSADTRLDGLSFFVTVHFPGALHKGNGEAQPIIDERATPAQREALFGIMSGQNSAEALLHGSAVEPGEAIECFQQDTFRVGEVRMIRARNNSKKSPNSK